MKTSVFKKLLLSAGVVALLGGEASFANSDPNTNAAFDAPVVNPPGFDLYNFVGAKSIIGLDGNLRILWDIYTGSATLDHSLVWILDGTGNFLATTPNFPAGASLPWIEQGFKSNIIIQGQQDGNTTVVFVFSANKDATTGIIPPPADSLSVLTFKANGQVVSGVGPIGPFAGTFIENVHFSGANIVVQWVSRAGGTSGFAGETGPSSTHTAWTLNEFGGLTGAAGPFAFLNTDARVELNSTGQQVWLWDSGVDTSSGAFSPSAANTLAVWVVNPDGSLASSHQYGPF